MTDKTDLERLAECSVSLCRAYADLGHIVYVIRQNHDGTVNICGPAMPHDVVADLLSKASAGYVDNAPQGGINLN